MTDSNFLVPQNKLQSMVPTKLPCPFSAEGMQQPSHLQAPPMFGPRGPTIPPKHLAPYAHFKINRSQSRPRFEQRTFQNQFRNKNPNPRHHNNFDRNNQTKSPQQHHQQQHHKKTREFWCEPCDRDFRSQDLLLEHKGQHQKCGIDGCKFEGHEMIVNKHIQMQHSTGLYERLKNLETPEDIVKWREERKKRYPTKANIELRQQMQEERNKRGEKLTNSTGRFGRNSDRRRCNNQPTDGNRESNKNTEVRPGNKREGKGKNKRRRPNKKVVTTVEQPVDKNENEDKSNNGLPMFRGTSQLKNYKKRKETQPKNALSSLLGAYDSDSSSGSQSFSDETASSDDMESEATTKSISSQPPGKHFVESTCDKEQLSNIPEQVSSLENDYSIDFPPEELIDNSDCMVHESTHDDAPANSDLDDLPNEERIGKMEEKVDPVPMDESSSKTSRSRKTKAKPMDKRLSKRPTVMDLSKKYRNQNTMLEKLLQNEIRHERNVLLQCVRHVVKENFFGIGQKPATS